jgi:hypothetical protein
LELASFTLAIVSVIYILGFVAYWRLTGVDPIDTHNYFIAAERLNQGLPLYSRVYLAPGSGPAAFYSPPLLPVLLRPLAALPESVGVGTWLVFIACCELGAVAYVWRRVPLAGLALFVLAPFVALAVEVGNVDGFIVASAFASWWLVNHGRQTRAGFLLGLSASLKLTPLALVWWALAQGYRRLATAAVVTGIVLAALAVAGSNELALSEFVGVTLGNYQVAPGPASLASVAHLLGMSVQQAAWVPRIALVSGLFLVVALRRWPAVAWAISVGTMVFGSPVTAWHSPALLLAALAPLASSGAGTWQSFVRKPTRALAAPP